MFYYYNIIIIIISKEQKYNIYVQYSSTVFSHASTTTNNVLYLVFTITKLQSIAEDYSVEMSMIPNLFDLWPKHVRGTQ